LGRIKLLNFGHIERRIRSGPRPCYRTPTFGQLLEAVPGVDVVSGGFIEIIVLFLHEIKPGG
jgi:hypothetical protein